MESFGQDIIHNARQKSSAKLDYSSRINARTHIPNTDRLVHRGLYDKVNSYADTDSPRRDFYSLFYPFITRGVKSPHIPSALLAKRGRSATDMALIIDLLRRQAADKRSTSVTAAVSCLDINRIRRLPA